MGLEEKAERVFNQLNGYQQEHLCRWYSETGGMPTDWMIDLGLAEVLPDEPDPGVEELVKRVVELCRTKGIVPPKK